MTLSKDNIIEVSIGLVPLISGFITSYFCNVGKKAGEKVKFRPPSGVFAIAWIILYLLFGISIVLSKRKNNYSLIPNILTIILLNLWIIFYGCLNNKKASVFILLASILTTFISYSMGTEMSKIIISPLLIWLLFALLMNTTEVQEEK
jgi:tryptophan-rich sensory protein